MIDALARILVLPLWTGPIDPRLLEGGLSNQSFTVESAGRKYVVRFGDDYVFHHVSRSREVMTAKAAYEAGFAPEVVYTSPGVMVSQFIEGRTFTAEDMRSKVPEIARMVKRFHIEMPNHVSGPGFMFWPFHVIRDYALTLKADRRRTSEHLAGYVELAGELEKAQVPLPIVFGHNDFLPANLLHDGERLWIIDYEYAGFSTAMFDLAGIASNAGFSKEESDELLALYFDAPPTADIRRSHSAMQCASLLREAMWGMVSEVHLDNPGIDYAGYAQLNLNKLEAALDAYRSEFGKS
jgi:thiamine kinase-like enzyme